MKTAFLTICFASILLASGCGDGSSEDDQQNQTTNNSTTGNAGNVGSNATTNGMPNAETSNNSTNNGTTNNGSTTSGTSNNATTNSTTNNASTSGDCDFEAIDGIITIEAESLPLNEDWQVGSEEADYQGNGYAFWSGSSHNNDPTHGVMAIKVRITEPGRYQLHWRAMIGMGTNTTEHNDAWIRFPDAADYYGLKGEEGAEIRRYYKPKCEDQASMDAAMALPDVETADCARGSTRDGWMKVYGAGQEWRWSGNTSDSDASTVTAEFPQAGVYTIEFAARADFFLLDTIVFHLESINRNDARGLPESACR